MSEAFIAGVGMTQFAKHTHRRIEDIGCEAVLKSIKDAGLEREDIEEAFCGSAFGGSLIGQRVLRDLGMTRIPITNVENACSSSASALREAMTAVVVGRAKTVLVFGLDQLTRLGGGTIPLEVADVEAAQGMTMPALYAMRAQRYMAETSTTTDHFARVAVKAHANAVHNPYAQFRNKIAVREVNESRMVADPLRLLMCCPTGDGASAVVVTTKRHAAPGRRRAVRVAASALQSGLYETGFRDMAWSELTARTCSLAYEQSAVGPEDVDLAEVHDAFASAEMMYYEALGFCERGGAHELIERGETSIGGRIPVNPSGGLLCRGHPVGATGTAQVCEAVWQLRGEAGARQIEGARVALTHCTGGGISGLDHGACAVHILMT